MQIRIGAQRIDVVPMPAEDDTGDLGRWHWEDQKIEIKGTLRGQAWGLTLLHEILHAVSDLHGLDLTEQDVRSLEQAFGSFCLDNPLVAQRIANALKPGD